MGFSVVHLLFFFTLFLVISAFFSATETALTASSRVKVRHLLEKNANGARALNKILQNPRQLISAIVIGNNIFDICATVVGTDMLQGMLHQAGLHNPLIMFPIITAVLTFVLLFFGEVIPKSFVIHAPERWGLIVSKAMMVWMRLVWPLVMFFESILQFFSRYLGSGTLPISKILSVEEVKTTVKIAHEEGVLDQEEQDMIQSIIQFKEKIVREIMTPRTDAVCIPATATVAEAIALIKEKGHSRIPAFEDKLDNTVGVLYAKDLLNVTGIKPEELIKTKLRDAVFIPETNRVEDLFHQMQRTKFHLAIVVDEHGGMSGVVTIEDIVEEILGDIQDEYDTDEVPEITRISDTHFVVDAGVNINTISEELDVAFPEDAEYDTLGGFVLSVLKKFPAKGEEILHHNLRIRVQDVSKRRIKLLEIWKEEMEHDAQADADLH